MLQARIVQLGAVKRRLQRCFGTSLLTDDHLDEVCGFLKDLLEMELEYQRFKEGLRSNGWLTDIDEGEEEHDGNIMEE